MPNAAEELWKVMGNDPVLFTLPVYVTWDGGMEGCAIAGVPLLRIQEQAFRNLMQQHARSSNGSWYIIRSELRKIGQRAKPGTDPERLLSWERPYSKPRNEKNRDRNEFLDSLYHLGVGQSRDELGRWWYLFCNHALDWLVNKERPIDMYFLKLHPFPWRCDWIQHTERARLKENRGRKLFRRLSAQNLRKTLAPWLGDWLKSGSLLSVDNHHAIRRHIAVEHMPMWWRTIRKVETIRLSRLNPIRYAAEVFESVRLAVPAAARIYRDWLAHKEGASGMYVKSRNCGVPRLFAIPRGKAEPAAPWGTSQKYRDAVKLLNPQKYYERERQRRALNVSRKAQGLPPVPGVQPQDEDLRDTGGDVGSG